MGAGQESLSPGQLETVLGAASAGAGWAFEALYRHFAPSVVGYLRVQGVRDPDDLCSEVFVAVFRGLGDFEGCEEQFRAWLFTIAHHRIIDDRRRRSRRMVETAYDDMPELDGPADTEGEALGAIQFDHVAQLVNRLPADQRDVLLMRLVGDLTAREVAHALGKSEGAVKSLQRRGVNHLRKLLIQEISMETVP